MLRLFATCCKFKFAECDQAFLSSIHTPSFLVGFSHNFSERRTVLLVEVRSIIHTSVCNVDTVRLQHLTKLKNTEIIGKYMRLPLSILICF